MEIVGHKVISAPTQTPNCFTKTLDWYDIIPHFGDESNNCDRKILYKFYDKSSLCLKNIGRKTWC